MLLNQVVFIVVMFHVQHFEPHMCIVLEGFGAIRNAFIIIAFIIIITMPLPRRGWRRRRIDGGQPLC